MDSEPSLSSLSESLIRMEAKIDVVLSRHEQRLEDHARRLGEHQSTLREYDARITANALTIAETRTQVANVAGELTQAKEGARRSMETLKSDTMRAVEDSRPKNVAQWTAVVVAIVATVVSIVAVVLGY